MARRQQKQSFEWDVQPYQFLYQLRAQYTQAVLQATRNSAAALAVEATSWMKQHAPWQDRTEAARKGLRAYVVDRPEEGAAYEEGRAAAKNIDDLLLDELVLQTRERREAAQRRLGVLQRGQAGFSQEMVRRNRRTKEIVKRYTLEYPEVPPQPKAASRLKYNLRTQRQYRRPRSVPKGRSAVAQFEKEWKGQVSQLVEVKFKHNTKLSYPIWLEIANQGRYAIIAKAVGHFSPVMMAKIKQIANLKQFRDKLAIAPQRTQAEIYQEFVREEEWEKGKPYEPWSKERQQRRKARRMTYNREAEKARREDNRAYLANPVKSSGKGR